MKKYLALLWPLLLCCTSNRWAQPYPSKLIRIVIPYAAGGTTDAMARVMQVPLQKILGQTVLVDNKPGASGILAAREVIRAQPDGCTLFFVNNGNLAVTPYVVKEANYDAAKDFSPVALVSTAPMVAVVPAALPVNDLRSFIDDAKKNPVAYASAGIGSFGQLATELLANRAGLKMTHIPYKGQGPTTIAALSGEVQLHITTPSGAMNDFIAQKRLKLLAVTSAEASPLEPGTPPVSTVLPGYVAESWFALVGPAGMPADVVAKLNDAVGKVLQMPEIQQRFAAFGVIPRSATPQKLGEMTAAEIARRQPVIRDNNIRADCVAPSSLGGEGWVEGRPGHAGASRALTPTLSQRERESIQGSQTLLCALAVAGLGLTRLADYHIAAEVAAGRLVTVLDAFQTAPEPIYAVYASERHLSMRVRVFLEHIASRLRTG